MRRVPEPRVSTWLDVQRQETLYLSAITVAELRVGIAIMPAGSKRNGAHERLERRVLPLFTGRVRAFDVDCTIAYAALMAKAKALGVAVTTADGYIAAVALTNGFKVATRDTRPFVAAGVDVINPWGQEC